MDERLAGVLVFFTWWATWTLLDFYLIPFTPVSEVATLLVCACVYFGYQLAQAARARCKQGRQRLDDVLDRI